MKDYRKYTFCVKEILIYTPIALGLVAAAAFIFYKSILAVLFLSPVAVLFFKYRRLELLKKQQFELAMEFKEALNSVNNSLQAGYSVENSFLEAGRDMTVMFGSDAFITEELKLIARKLHANEPLENALYSLAERSGVDDIRDFADVFSAAKRSGGDMNRIIRRASETISEKMDVKREIETLTAAKKFENRIMDVVPFAIIAYIGLTSPDFIEGLYHNPVGIAIMTVCLIIYAVAFFMAEKIVNIRI
ncbi:MAG: type II secretion system F family protein [Lachnospiraceae bacterium]|nr:type II secretion system F family protein [Lachnospiraceae bacterium]